MNTWTTGTDLKKNYFLIKYIIYIDLNKEHITDEDYAHVLRYMPETIKEHFWSL